MSEVTKSLLLLTVDMMITRRSYKKTSLVGDRRATNLENQKTHLTLELFHTSHLDVTEFGILVKEVQNLAPLRMIRGNNPDMFSLCKERKKKSINSLRS